MFPEEEKAMGLDCWLALIHGSMMIQNVSFNKAVD
jgi:hypothetical protein